MKKTMNCMAAALALLAAFALLACKNDDDDDTPAPVCYTVSYETDFGTAPAPITVEAGTKLDSSQLPTLTHSGYTFGGWYFVNYSSNIPYANAGNFPINSDCVVYALWTLPAATPDANGIVECNQHNLANTLSALPESTGTYTLRLIGDVSKISWENAQQFSNGSKILQTLDLSNATGAFISDGFSLSKIYMKELILPDTLEKLPHFFIHWVDEKRVSDYLETVRGKGITEIAERAFYHGIQMSQAYALKNVVVGSNITSIGERAFERCGKLESITCADADSRTATTLSIGKDAFYQCENLTTVALPITKTNEYAFWNCKKLATISLPSITELGTGTFESCTKLATVTLGAGLEAIPESAFSSCRGLSTVTVPSTVTYIGNRAFSGCTSLASITIPSAVTNIELYAFSGCTSLASVTFECTDGWYKRHLYSNSWEAESIDVSDASANATMLTENSTYSYFRK